MSDFINHAMCHETKSDDNDGSDNDKVISDSHQVLTSCGGDR